MTCFYNYYTFQLNTYPKKITKKCENAQNSQKTQEFQ
jgi:hypothetical protein